MKQNGIFLGRTEILYPYGRYGWTRGNGKTWQFVAYRKLHHDAPDAPNHPQIPNPIFYNKGSFN